MKLGLISLLTTLSLFFAASAFAFTVPPRPDNGWYIVDSAGKLSDSDKSTLNHKIDGINKSSKNEIGVLIIPTLGDDNLEDAAKDVFHMWGIGKKGLDNGVLLMIVTNDRKIRLEIGKGAEGDLTDLQSKDIITKMKPQLKNGDYVGGITTAVDNINSTIESRANVKPIASSPVVSGRNDSIGFIFLGMFGLFAIIAGGVWFFAVRPKKKRFNHNSYDSYQYNKSSAYSNSSKYSYSPPAAPTNEAVKDAVAIAGAAGLVGAVVAVSEIERKRKLQLENDSARKARDASNRTTTSSSSSSSSIIGSSYDSGSSGSSWGGGDSGGGGFGGGDSGGGGASGDF